MVRSILAASVGAAALLATPAMAATAKREQFGTLSDGQAVGAVVLTNGHGVTARVIAYGATLQSLTLPDRNGKMDDVVVGSDTVDGLIANPQFFGATVGRFANRIAKGTYTLDGQTYHAPTNDGPNMLHGGPKGFDKQLWEITDVKSGSVASVTLRYVSPDGDMGFPGQLTTYATYSLDEQNRLTVDYRATTNKPTIVNLSNHTYWNLGGVTDLQSAMGTVLTIPANRYTPIDATSIPTGELPTVAGTPFDFRTPHAIGARVRDGHSQQLVNGRGYDHNWVIGDAVTRDLHLMARAVDPASGRGFELYSNQPGLQFYSGNFLNGTATGKNKQILREGDAFVMEPQVFPDAPNQPSFPSARLAPGETYHNVIVYRFTTTPKR